MLFQEALLGTSFGFRPCKYPLKVFPLPDIEGCLFSLPGEHVVIFPSPPRAGLGNYSMFSKPGQMGQDGGAVLSPWAPPPSPTVQTLKLSTNISGRAVIPDQRAKGSE